MDKVDSTSTASASSHKTSGSAPKALDFTELAERFLGLIRFSHTIFALPFAGLACVLAIVSPGYIWPGPTRVALQIVAVLACMVFARSAAMAFNRVVDADVDALNPRTVGRHIPAGLLSRGQVWGFFLSMCLGFLLSCLLFLPNWLPIAASLPVLGWICGYSFAKRFTSGAHLWLGVALALSPICSWVALRGPAVLADWTDLHPPLSLAMAIALWVAGFDIIYACQDAQFDRDNGLQSVPSRFGTTGALRISAALHGGMLLVLAWLPIGLPQLSLGWFYWLGYVTIFALVIRQHAIVRPDDLSRVGEAFFTLNAIISVGLSLVIALDACIR